MVCHVIIQNLIGLFIHRNLFDYIDIRPENIHILNGNAHDLLAECASYETTIKKAGGLNCSLEEWDQMDTLHLINQQAPFLLSLV